VLLVNYAALVNSLLAVLLVNYAALVNSLLAVLLVNYAALVNYQPAFYDTVVIRKEHIAF